MKPNTNSLIDILQRMARKAELDGGVWCPRGGVGTSMVAITRHTCSLVVFDRPGPAEGRRATLVTPDGQFVTLTQHWHGGPESGDWWWTL